MSNPTDNNGPNYSPWGVVQNIYKLTDGIFWLSTASHGGFKVYDKLNQKIPELFRIKDGWYEADVEWAVVVHFLPQFFSNEEFVSARKTLRSWKWEKWEQYFGEEISLEESPHKSETFFLREHARDLLTISAFGDWHKNVPKGMVGVIATKGGRRDTVNQYYYLLTAEEYDTGTQNPSGSIVIDPIRHQKWVGPYLFNKE